MRTVMIGLALAALGACSPGSLGDRSHPTGSRTFVEQDRVFYGVNPWDGTIVRHEPGADGWSDALEIGGVPTRIAPVGKDELWVTLRATREVAILTTTSTLPEVTERLLIGAEPHGIVASEDGSRVYVALSQQDEVVEIDGASRDVLRRFAVADEPRGLALHPSGRALFVQHAFLATITRIDLETGDVTTHEPPSTNRVLPPEIDEETSTVSSEEVVDLTLRPTGDPTINPDGDVLVTPTLCVDNTTPVDDPVQGGGVSEGGGDSYASAGGASGQELSISRMNPALVGLPLDPRTATVRTDEPSLIFFVGGVDQRGRPVRGYPSAVTFAPRGSVVYVTLESADAIVALDLVPFAGQGLQRPRGDVGDGGMSEPDVATSFDTGGEAVEPPPPFVPPSTGGFWERPKLVVLTGENPSGAVVGDDGSIYVYEAGERAVSDVNGPTLTRALDQLRVEQFAESAPLDTVRRKQVGTSLLDPDVEAGRALFYSADDARMAGEGAGVSCSTCHFEGRNDGLTWTFEGGVRQTPSLAGAPSQTEPVTWTDGVASVADEATITSQGRMGGSNLTPNDAAQIEEFVNSIRPVDTENSGSSSGKILRGKDLFNSPEVGCAICHSGPQYTDNLAHDMFGLIAVNTPTLVGIDATAPYLHDGRASTLRELLLLSRSGEMGYTGSLSDGDLDALEAFLRTL